MAQRYQNLSIELVRRVHPSWPTDRLVAQAEIEWESAATNWMTQVQPPSGMLMRKHERGADTAVCGGFAVGQVLKTLRSLRPRARFG